VKPLDDGDVAEVVSHVWWDNCADQRVEGNKANYFMECQIIKEAIASNETILQ
jgi:hypothetical protein